MVVPRAGFARAVARAGVARRPSRWWRSPYCIAVVAFALVAILGVMPTGLQVQKDNREDTIINQDGSFWLETLRSGARGMDELTNYVDRITIKHFDLNGVPRRSDYVFGNGSSIGSTNTFTNGLQIVGLLSVPKYEREGSVWLTNSVVAYVRAFSGSAADKPDGARTRATKDIAFGYRLTTEVVPYNPLSRALTNNMMKGLTDLDRTNRYELRRRAVNMEGNFHEIRLTMEWPLYPTPDGLFSVGGRRKVLATIAPGSMVSTNIPKLGPLYWIEPSIFVQAK